MKRLIVTADDVGLHPGMTAGAIRAHREGIVTACSIVANGAAFDDAVERLREVPELDVGVHLSLVEEPPLTGIRLPRNYLRFLPRYPFLPRAAVERELRAQIERVLATGLPVTHLNGHQHLHVLYLDVVGRLAEEYGVGYVRIPAEGGRHDAGLLRTASVAALGVLAQRGRRNLERVKTNDRTIGITEAGRIDAATLRALVETIGDGISELVTHPGIGDAALARTYAWGYAWDAETSALCDAGVRAAIERLGIVLTAPRHIG